MQTDTRNTFCRGSPRNGISKDGPAAPAFGGLAAAEAKVAEATALASGDEAARVLAAEQAVAALEGAAVAAAMSLGGKGAVDAADVAGRDECACCGPYAPTGHDSCTWPEDFDEYSAPISCVCTISGTRALVRAPNPPFQISRKDCSLGPLQLWF